MTESLYIVTFRRSEGTTKESRKQSRYPVFVPFKGDNATPKPKRVLNASKASFEIDALSTDVLPTLHHVISRLAELPVIEVVAGRLVEAKAYLRCHRLIV